LSAISALSVCVTSRFKLRDATFGSTQSRHELLLVNHTFRVTVNQPLHATLQLAKLRFQDLEILGALANSEPLLMLLLQPLWTLQQPAYFRPDGCFNEFTSDLRIVADSLSPEAITIRAGAAIVGKISESTTCASLSRRLSVISTSALRAAQKTLKQIARPPYTYSGAGAVLI